MNNAKIIQSMQECLEKSDESAGYVKIYEDNPRRGDQHEFLFFIKPEITQSVVRERGEIFNLTLRKISQFDLHIQDIMMLSASYLEKYDIIARHYGVINALSREPLRYFSGEARSRFTEIYGKRPEELKVLGGLQFLQIYQSATPDMVGKLWQKSNSVKLASGTYCAGVTYQDEEMYLINGFHPQQLMHFIAKGRSIIAFTLTGNLDWSEARNRFMGKTNPADASEGSLRNELLVKKEQFGLDEVSSSRNGFHLSAGPVEGLVELIRYCSDFASGDMKNTGDFVFGRQLKAIFSGEEIDKICSNQPVDHKGNMVSTFDLTEEKNSQDALKLLKESKLN